MKKRFMLLILLPLFLFPIFADEYEGVYDLIVPESFSYLTVDGGLWNAGGNSSQLDCDDNIIEVDLGSNSFSLDLQGDSSYRFYNQEKDSELDIRANGSLRVGTISTSLFANINANYTSYDLDISGMPGFWYVGGSGSLNAVTSSLTYNFRPAAAIGVGRTYSIYNIYKAKLLMENLGVTPTVDKVRAVISVMQKSNEILNKFSDNSSELRKEYYQKIADAMGISDRAYDVTILDNWNSQKYSYQRAKYISMINGWDARFTLDFEYNKFIGSSSLSLETGPEAKIGSFIMDDMLYFDANAQAKLNYTLNGSLNFSINTQARGVYLFDNYRMWAEAIADIDFVQGNTTPFQFDIAGAGYYLINNNFVTYAGLQIDESPNLSLFVGGEIRIW